MERSPKAVYVGETTLRGYLFRGAVFAFQQLAGCGQSNGLYPDSRCRTHFVSKDARKMPRAHMQPRGERSHAMVLLGMRGDPSLQLLQ